MDIDWSASVLDEDGNIINCGNTLSETDQNMNFHIIKLSKDDGLVMWEKEWNSAYNGNDYATALTISGPNLFVTGVATSVGGMFDLVVLNINLLNGGIEWTYVYDNPQSLIAIPAAIEVDVYFGIYVTGATSHTSLDTDFLTLKLDNTSGAELWASTYNYQSYYDGGIKIAFRNDDVIVTGFSGVSLQKALISTISYSKTYGTLQNFVALPNSGNFFDKLTDIATDIDGNIVICGEYSHANSGVDMKVIKLDADLSIIWQFQWDGNALNDYASALAVDPTGNIYITGSTTNIDIKTEMITLAINSSGAAFWEKRKLVKPLYEETAGKDIAFAYGKLIAVGYLQRNGNKDIVIECFRASTGFPDWLKEVNYSAASSEIPSKIQIVSSSQILISSQIIDNGIKQYLTSKVEFNRKNSQPHMNHGKPEYAAHQVIIRFNPASLKTVTIDDRNIEYGALTSFISPEGLIAINTALNTEAKDFKIYKIFPGIKTTDQTSIARDGVERKIAPYYSWLILELPLTMNPVWVCEQLNEVHKHIVNMSLNLIGTLDEVPDDSFYFLDQKGLHWSPLYIQNGVYDINMESVWDICSGYSIYDQMKPVVGIYDSGVKFTHDDLQSSLGHTVSGGQDFFQGGNATVFDTGDPDGHGTKVSGIISGTKNNNLGIAGIAGGNSDNTNLESLPMELQVNRIFGDSTAITFFPNLGDSLTSDSLTWTYVDAILSAQVLSSLSIFSSHPVTVINQSYSGNWSSYGNTWGVTDEFSLVNRGIFNQQCVNACSRGNYNTSDKRWPCITFGPEEQQLCIGASDSVGIKADFSSYGGGLDITAPGIHELVLTTSNVSDSFYSSFDGTSAATPHVSGVAALMQSYVNNHVDAPNPIGPDDIEKLMERFADDAVDDDTSGNEIIGYEDYSGWGKLNAGRIFDSIALPQFRIWHFDLVVSEDDLIQQPNIVLQWRRDIALGAANYTASSYEFEVYKIVIDYYHDIAGSHVIDAWGRNSVSEVASLDSMGTSNLFLYPFPDIQIEYVDDDHAIVTGYIFKFANSGQWFPSQQYLNNMIISYSLYTEGGFTAITEAQTIANFAVYPNPNNGNFTIDFPVQTAGDAEIDVYDTYGNLVWIKGLKARKVGLHHEKVCLQNLSCGLYLVTVKIENNFYSAKIFKQ